MKYLTLIAATLFVGCSTTTDVTDNLPLSFELGSVRLETPAFLCRDSSNYFDHEVNIELLVNYGFEECPVGEHVVALPVGTQLEIVKVLKFEKSGLISADSWYAIGSYTSKVQYFEFFYELRWVQDANGSYEKLDFVPWQGNV